MRIRGSWARITFTALAVATLTAGCVVRGGAGPGTPFGGQTAPAAFTSNGQRIYFTATSNSDNPITYQGGPSGGMMMPGHLACASCHGPAGKGGTAVMMMQTIAAPNITWPVLTEAQHDGGEMDHPPFTVETVKRAITKGVDPAGNPLNSQMPRWSMSASDLADLVAYLQTLQ